MTIRLLLGMESGSTTHSPGAILNLNPALEADLVSTNRATWVTPPALTGDAGKPVQAVMSPGGGIEFPGLSPLTSAVRNAVQYIVSHADLDARPPRLWPVDAVPYRLFCQVDGVAFGHGDSNRTIVTVDTATRSATVGHEFPTGHTILDIYAGWGCALIVLLKSADNTHSLYRTTDGQTVEWVHDFGRDPNGDLAHRTHVRLLTRGLEKGQIDGQPALVFATYTGADQTPGTIDDAIYIAKSMDDGRTWQRVSTWNWNFETGAGAHTIRHFHAVRYDKWRDCWWIAAGDTDDESCIIRWDGKAAGPGNVSPAQMQAGTVPGWDCRTGSQRWRAVDLLVTEDWIESFTDTVSYLTGGIWRMRPDFSESHRVDHSNVEKNHDGWAALLASDGTHLWCDSCRADTTANGQRYVGIYASKNGNRYWEIGRIALAGTGAQLPRGFFQDDAGLIWYSQSGEAGKGLYATTVMRLQGRFIDERPDCLAPAYFVDFANGLDTNDGRTAATAWKTVRTALLGNVVTHGARVMVSAGASTENGLASIEYAANAVPAVDTDRPVQISGQGRAATAITISGATEGWRGTSVQPWNVELCDLTIKSDVNTKSVLIDNSTYTGAQPQWTVRDAYIGDAAVGCARAVYSRSCAVRGHRSVLATITDAAKYTFTVEALGVVDLRSCMLVGGRGLVSSAGTLAMRHCNAMRYANAAVLLSANTTTPPLIANSVFSDSLQSPITNSSTTITLTDAMVYGNYYARPAGPGVPASPLPVAGQLGRHPDTLEPYSWAGLCGLASPAGVSWDYYGNPFRARPAIGAVEIPPTF